MRNIRRSAQGESVSLDGQTSGNAAVLVAGRASRLFLIDRFASWHSAGPSVREQAWARMASTTEVSPTADSNGADLEPRLESREIWETLARCSLFSQCSSAMLRLLAGHAVIKTFGEGDRIAAEGETAAGISVIESGTAGVQRIANSDAHTAATGWLHAGDHFGEISAVGAKPHARTVVAATPVRVVEIPAAAVQEVTGIEGPAVARTGIGLMTDMCRRFVSHKLNDTNLRVVMGNFMVLTIVTLCALAWFVSLAPKLVANFGGSNILSCVMLGGNCLLLGQFIKRSRFGRSFFGLNLNGWRRSLREGILWSLPVMVAAVVVKLVLIQYAPAFEGRSLLESHPSANSVLLVSGYLSFIPVQELMFRGGVQGALQHFIVGPHRVLLSVIVSSIIFATVHLHVSPQLAVVCFGLGLLWGWMYARHRTLLGATVSHLILGAWGFYIVDLGLGAYA